ncbi:unnamed protein product [Pylaiella littoralis]
MVRVIVAMAMAAGLAQSVVAVMDMGDEHVCTTVGSTPKCWGANNWGQLGREDNTTNVGDDPDELGDNLVGVAVGGIVSEMALGGEHTCMLLDSGDVVCFGHNDKGQLGLGDTVNRGQTVGSVGETVSFGTDLTAVAITSGCEHTCGLLDDGSVKCFGYNNFGQLGQGTTDDMGDDDGEMGDDLTTVPLSGTVAGIAAGCDFTCALMEDGSVMCWGRNNWGQLGTGDSDDRLDGSNLELVAVDLNGSVAVEIAAGEGHTCARLEDASIKCWGHNNVGQLGQGDDVDRGDSAVNLGVALAAVSLGTGDVPTGVDCGSSHTCVLLDDGSVKCFGANDDGQLGTGTTDSVGTLPTEMGDNLVAVAFSDPVSDVAAGGSSTCAVSSDDSVTCWGRGNNGQLGQGNDEDIRTVVDVAPVDVGSDVLSLTPAPSATLPVTPIPSSPPTAAPSTSTASVDPSAAPTSLTTFLSTSTTPSPSTTQPVASSVAPTAPTTASSFAPSAAPTAASRQAGFTSGPTVTPVTLAPLGPGETHSPTPAPSDLVDVDTEGSGAPAHFNAGLLATVTLGAAGFMGALFL